jgi:putative FmdB family regulatory protein
MPIYDYLCLDCQRRFEVYLSYAEYGTRQVQCPHCQSPHVRRRLPRVRLARSEEGRLESLADDFSDPSALEGLEEDPRAMGRFMRKMGQELGEEMPPEFDEVVERLEKGQRPEEIEKEMPELGGEESTVAEGGDDLLE